MPFVLFVPFDRYFLSFELVPTLCKVMDIKMERTVLLLMSSVSTGMYLNACVAGELVNGFTKDHSDDLGWPVQGTVQQP